MFHDKARNASARDEASQKSYDEVAPLLIAQR
jgi:hypothetical protein